MPVLGLPLPKLRALNLPWRLPEIELGPIHVGNRRLYILPTRQGLVFAGLLIGLLIGSTNYGISLGYLFTFLLGGLGTVTMFHTQRNLSGLVLKPGQTPSVFAGDTALCRLHVENATATSRHALQLSSAGGDVTFDVPAEGAGLTEISVQPLRRGLHPIGRLTLSSSWPLGLFRCWTVVQPDWNLLAYPSPSPIFWPLPKPSAVGRESAGERPGDDTFSGLRGYRPGDSPRHIAWKAVASGLSLQTKQFTGQSGSYVWLDWDDAPERDVEARLSRLTRWALDAEKTGLVWGLKLPNRSVPPGQGDGHLKTCLEILACHEA